jgi:hypothetical protein
VASSGRWEAEGGVSPGSSSTVACLDKICDSQPNFDVTRGLPERVTHSGVQMGSHEVAMYSQWIVHACLVDCMN